MLNDYEQMYYDEVFKNKKLIIEKQQLNDELDIYKKIIETKDLKKILIEILMEYRKGKRDGKNE